MLIDHEWILAVGESGELSEQFPRAQKEDMLMPSSR
jgi:hypothetical protein